MLTEITLDQIIGKTVSAYSESFTSGQFVLVFTDGTFTTLKGGEGGLVSGSKIRLMNFEREYLVAVGIATNEELEILRTERAEKIRLSSEAAERNQYERLRAKFEGKDTP
jgi:predicted RNA-binding protein with RPS1 domain